MKYAATDVGCAGLRCQGINTVPREAGQTMPPRRDDRVAHLRRWLHRSNFPVIGG